MDAPIAPASKNSSGTVFNAICRGIVTMYGIAKGILRKKRNGFHITKEKGKKFQIT